MTRLAPEGRPFIGGALALTVAAWAAAVGVGGWLHAVAAACTVLTLFVVYFFRDPRREGPDDPGAVLAPADGRVVEIAEVEEPTWFRGACRRVSIFL
ncbi:MAG TPA: phosphatidylserine decarboxylase, partial [Longimicrobiales bacterium]|nr:phosphatidylserine decarboxylase [Longimicrobiales bacterium]